MPTYLVTLRSGQRFRVTAESKQAAEAAARKQVRSLAAHQNDPAKRKEFLARAKVMPGRTTTAMSGDE